MRLCRGAHQRLVAVDDFVIVLDQLERANLGQDDWEAILDDLVLRATGAPFKHACLVAGRGWEESLVVVVGPIVKEEGEDMRLTGLQCCRWNSCVLLPLLGRRAHERWHGLTSRSRHVSVPTWRSAECQRELTTGPRNPRRP